MLAARSRLLASDTLVSQQHLEDLRVHVVSPSVESYELDGRLWALPVYASCRAAVYCQDLVSSAALPATWEQVAKWAAATHAPPHRYGIVLSVESVLGHCRFLSLMAGAGHPAYLDPEHPTCNQAAS